MLHQRPSMKTMLLLVWPKPKCRLSISQAIASAEQPTPGKVTRAQLENENHGLIYTVEVANPATKNQKGNGRDRGRCQRQGV